MFWGLCFILRMIFSSRTTFHSTTYSIMTRGFSSFQRPLLTPAFEVVNVQDLVLEIEVQLPFEKPLRSLWMKKSEVFLAV